MLRKERTHDVKENLRFTGNVWSITRDLAEILLCSPTLKPNPPQVLPAHTLTLARCSEWCRETEQRSEIYFKKCLRNSSPR